jgi:hypothetical protein
MTADPTGGTTMTAAPPVVHTHPYDLGSALAGVVFAAAGVAFILGRLEVIELRQAIVLPAVIVGLGAALVLGSIQRHRGE